MKTPFARFSSWLFALGSLGVLTAAATPFTDGKWVHLTHEFSSDTLNKAVSLTSLRFVYIGVDSWLNQSLLTSAATVLF
ncbi:MAG: hypothetical protein DME21_15215 [Verrucomicrobia bacterium]|nr:MAG: hypothetical protein DME21_15215 [Verrucomicrobiota bacterium]